MERYNFGDPEGRYIGDYGPYSVYTGAISRNTGKAAARTGLKPPMPGEFDFYYGPSTGGMIESVGIKLVTPGEMITSVEVNPDFKKRKIKVKGMSVKDALLRVERINGFHAASHATAFLGAVEDALRIKVSEPVKKARIAMMELERIRSHLEVIKRMGEPAGFGVPVNQLGYLREEVSRIISGVAGHRFYFGTSGIGTVSIDLSEIGSSLLRVKEEFKRIFEGLQKSKIFLNRLQNNGITKDEHLVGPAARAAGKEADARLDSTDLPYRDEGFKPVIRNEADCFGRFMVRGQEILASVEMIESIGHLPVQEKAPLTVSGSGEGAFRVESPQGDLFYYVKIMDGMIDDMWYVTPSFLNVRAFEQSMAGNIFTDFHFNWESFGIWISELGVEIS